uniref:Immunoglobulin C1-set domain-containing protein n=1 Tax=Hippocampus comes TaxID=109280 RepID=A0A3Q3DI62_HIPCM
MFESHVDVLFVCLFFLSAIHSLENFVMVSTGIANLPDHVGVVYVDHIAVMYYDSKSRILEPRNNWMTEATADDLDFWERERNAFNQSEDFRMPSNAFVILSGVHFGQARFGCEWDDQTDAVDAWEKMKYEDEHVMLLDVNTFTWTVEGPQALAIKHKFDFNELQRDLRKPCWLNKIHCLCLISCHVTFCAELPKVSLLQKMPSSPVTCHATGFYPYVADLFWRKDGEQLHEGVDYGQTLPNHDGTFQMTVDLKLEVTDEVEEEKKRRTVAIAASLVAVALVLVLVAIVVVIKCHPRKPGEPHKSLPKTPVFALCHSISPCPSFQTITHQRVSPIFSSFEF